jgi:hypothetical protein
MSIMTSGQIEVPPEVRDFVRKNRAEVSFRAVVSLVRECYPQLAGIDVKLLDDPDEEDWKRTMLVVRMPSIDFEELMSQKDRYHDRLVREVPLDQIPFFCVSLLAAESA